MLIVKSNFVIGLTAYLHQTALSLDRIPFNDMTPLIEFNKTLHHSLQDVLTRVGHLNHGRCPENQFQETVRWSFCKSLITFIRVHSHQLILIEYPRLCIVEIALSHYEQLLADKNKWSRRAFVDTRVEIAYSGALIESLIPSRFMRESICNVGHLNHAEHLTVKSVEEIAGDDWLG